MEPWDFCPRVSFILYYYISYYTNSQLFIKYTNVKKIFFFFHCIHYHLLFPLFFGADFCLCSTLGIDFLTLGGANTLDLNFFSILLFSIYWINSAKWRNSLLFIDELCFKKTNSNADSAGLVPYCSAKLYIVMKEGVVIWMKMEKWLVCVIVIFRWIWGNLYVCDVFLCVTT